VIHGGKTFFGSPKYKTTVSKTYLRCEYGRLNGNNSAKIRLSSVTDRTTQKRQAVNSNEDKIAVFGHLDFRIAFFQNKGRSSQYRGEASITLGQAY